MTDESLLKAIGKVIHEHLRETQFPEWPSYDSLIECTQCNDLAQAAIEAYEANQWRPIETAPKDGEYALTTKEGGAYPMVACYDDDHIYDGEQPQWVTFNMWYENFIKKYKPDTDPEWKPDYWMPLIPSPPKQEV